MNQTLFLPRNLPQKAIFGLFEPVRPLIHWWVQHANKTNKLWSQQKEIHYCNRFKGELNLGKPQHQLVEIIVLAVDKIVNDLNALELMLEISLTEVLFISLIHLSWGAGLAMSIGKALVATKVKSPTKVELPVLVTGLINFADNRLKLMGSIVQYSKLRHCFVLTTSGFRRIQLELFRNFNSF